MLVLGFAVAWFGYGMVVYGHSLVKGYNLSFSQVFSPTSFYKGTWPPPTAVNATIFPSGAAGDNATATSPTTAATSVAAINAQQAATAKNQGRPLPGSVQSRF